MLNYLVHMRWCLIGFALGELIAAMWLDRWAAVGRAAMCIVAFVLLEAAARYRDWR